MRMHRWAGGAFLAILAAGPAIGGYRTNAPVQVHTNGPNWGQAFGSVGDARNAAGTVERIYCVATARTTQQAELACGATDAASRSTFCMVRASDPGYARFVSALASLNDSSMIAFVWSRAADGRQVCSTLTVSNRSSLAPKELER